MDTNTLIDRILDYDDNVSSDDADNSTHRARVLEWAQQVFEYVWNFRPWRFKLANTTITVQAGKKYAVLPSNFQDFGPNGGAFYQDAQGVIEPIKLEEVSPQEIQTEKNRSGTTAKPQKFAAFLADDGVYRFQVGNNSDAVTFDIWYETIAPTLVDTEGVRSNLQKVPAGYHFTVLLAGVQEKSARDKGDQRSATEWGLIFRDGLKRMVARETGQRSSVERMPRATMGMW